MSRLDKALADLDHADSQTLVFRRSILNALLNPYASNSQKDIERATIPAGWQTSSLGVLADVLDNKRIPLSAAERKHREGPVPYYGATGQVGTIDKPLFDEPLVLLGEDGVQFFDPYKPKAYKIAGPSWVNNHAHVLRPKAEVIEFGYLLHYLNAFDYQGYANGTTRLKLTQGAMNSIPVHMPPLEEQRRIVETLDDHLSRIDSTRKSIANLKAGLAALRRSLLNKAYNGQLGTK
jgi:type I restriction enzyme S subunit